MERFLADEAASARFGEDVAAALRPGDVVALSGDLGAGKTALARGIIRALCADFSLDVPSPTFTLVQDYQARFPVRHFDLYRLGSPAELEEIGLTDAEGEGVSLVEWPERAGGLLQPAISIALREQGFGRTARIEGVPQAMERLARSLAARDFLAANGREDAHRTYLQGDASSRAYEAIDQAGQPTTILMNAPRQPDGPPIRDGKPYSRIAHLAESVAPFVAIANALRARGVAAPEIIAQDLDRGFLLIEHLGRGGFLDNGAPVAERYGAAAGLLADMHGMAWQRSLPLGKGSYTLPAYDRAAMLIEVELMADWYIPFVTGAPLPDADRRDFLAGWNSVLDGLSGAEPTIVLRDYHSPNLIWRPERAGNDRLGVIDFQDALYGPAAYDVASLAEDARVTISPELERETVSAYLSARARHGDFDRAAFENDYAIMAAQRNSKILGIFVRLDRRDGKPHYLAHLPRIRAYVERSLSHPALAPLRAIYARFDLKPVAGK